MFLAPKSVLKMSTSVLEEKVSWPGWKLQEEKAKDRKIKNLSQKDCGSLVTKDGLLLRIEIRPKTR